MNGSRTSNSEQLFAAIFDKELSNARVIAMLLSFNSNFDIRYRDPETGQNFIMACARNKRIHLLELFHNLDSTLIMDLDNQGNNVLGVHVRYRSISRKFITLYEKLGVDFAHKNAAGENILEIFFKCIMDYPGFDTFGNDWLIQKVPTTRQECADLYVLAAKTSFQAISFLKTLHRTKKVSLNTKCSNKDYPLHSLMKSVHNIRIIDTVIKLGANVNLVNFEGKTPIQVIDPKRFNAGDLLRLLCARGANPAPALKATTDETWKEVLQFQNNKFQKSTTLSTLLLTYSGPQF